MEQLEDVQSLENILARDLLKRTDLLLSGTTETDVEMGREPESPGMINRPKVLMYHRIVDTEQHSGSEFTCLHVDEFRRQLELLDRFHYTPITFEDYRLFQEGRLQLPQKPVILTFDDGYLDTYRLAYPLLKEYGMKAVVFVLGDRSIRKNRWDLGKGGFSEASLMTDNHILELYNSGFEIGSHTLSHSNLNELSPDECFREVHKPKIILEALLGGPIQSFSYPYGVVNPGIKKQIYRAGYRFACSVYSGPAQFGLDPLEIRRITVSNSISTIGFVARLVAPYEYLEWIWWKSRNGGFVETVYNS